MSKANQRQVDGTHYACEKQHWDFITENGIGYLEGCASKYVCRNRKKHVDPTIDLKKAVHYVDKLIEQGERGHCRPPFFMRWVMKFMDAVKLGAPVSINPPMDIDSFAAANNLTPRERLAFRLIVDWKDGNDLYQARELIQLMIEEHEAALNSQA